MREMKDSGIEWVGRMPSHWNVLPNKYIMQKIKVINPVYKGEDILSLTVNGVIVRDLDAGGKMPASFDGYQILYPDNLLMCLFDYDVTPRCIGLIRNNGVSSPAYSQFVLKDGNSSRYYYYYYLMIDHTKELLHLAKNLRHSFTEEQLGAIKTPVPPVDEQICIANYLDSKCTEIDILSAEIQSEIDALEEYKKSVIIEAVTKGLNNNAKMKDSGVFYVGPMNADWKITKLGYICNKVTRKFSPEDAALICTNKGAVTERGEKVVGLMTSDDNAMQGIHVGDIAIHGMDTWHGAIALSKLSGKITRVVHVCTSAEDHRFIVYYLQSLAYRDVYKLITNGVRGNTSDFRSWDKASDIYVTIPTREEQVLICDYLDSICEKISTIVTEKKEMLETLAEYKKSLIYEYVTGKKEVPTTNDDVVVLFDLNALWLGCIVDKLGKEQRGRTQIQKIKYLLDVHCGINPNNQYYRYNHGPYDINLNDHLGSLVGKKWFKQEHGKTITLTAGECHADFQNLCKERIGDKEPVIDSFLSLLQSMKVMKTSRLERIATLYAVWNDFLLDGITPTDDQIIQEVLSNWTENKAHSQYETWQDSLNKMKKHGLIPKGTGLHTLPKPEKDGGEAE